MRNFQGAFVMSPDVWAIVAPLITDLFPMLQCTQEALLVDAPDEAQQKTDESEQETDE